MKYCVEIHATVLAFLSFVTLNHITQFHEVNREKRLICLILDNFCEYMSSKH